MLLSSIGPTAVRFQGVELRPFALLHEAELEELRDLDLSGDAAVTRFVPMISEGLRGTSAEIRTRWEDRQQAGTGWAWAVVTVEGIAGVGSLTTPANVAIKNAPEMHLAFGKAMRGVGLARDLVNALAAAAFDVAGTAILRAWVDPQNRRMQRVLRSGEVGFVQMTQTDWELRSSRWPHRRSR